MKSKSVKLNMNSNAKRNARGTAALELASGSLVMIGIVAMALNVCFAILSYGSNDRACRDAARAAAQGSTVNEARQMAEAIVKTYNSTSGAVSTISVESVIYNDLGGNLSQELSPTVTVTTRALANLPAPVEFFGNNIFGKSLLLQKTYTFPIIRLNVNI